MIPVKGVFWTNCYFDIDDKTKHGFLIDAGAQPEKLLAVAYENGWTIEKILLTHGHFDHFGAVDALRQKWNCPVLVHENADLLLLNPMINLSAQCNVSMTLKNTVKFAHGDTISLTANPEFQLKVIHTAGHTPDSVVLYSEKDTSAFVGDTIFKQSIGNSGYPMGNHEKLLQSIAERIFILPDDIVLYSGHSEPTTVGAEKQFYGVGDKKYE